MPIRPAVPGDLRAVLDIAKTAFVGDDAFGAKWLVNKLACTGTSLFVDDAALSLIRGFMLLEQRELGVVVRLIATHPDCRRHGVGRGLLELVARPAYTWIRTTNEASQTLFRGMGWVEIEPQRKRRDWQYFHLPKVSG